MMQRLGVIGWLILASLIATIAFSVHPELIRYGMHGDFFANQRWDQLGLQFLLYSFLHGNALHLFSNAFFLVIIGIGVQYAMGWKRFLRMFIFVTIAVGIILMFTSQGSTIGMSGFAMAVLAYYTVMLWSVRNPQYKSGLVLIGINIFIGLDPSISLGGHLWGAVAGAVFWFIDDRIFKHQYKSFQSTFR